jgi:hypothetical protein
VLQRREGERERGVLHKLQYTYAYLSVHVVQALDELPEIFLDNLRAEIVLPT